MKISSLLSERSLSSKFSLTGIGLLTAWAVGCTFRYGVPRFLTAHEDPASVGALGSAVAEPRLTPTARLAEAPQQSPPLAFSLHSAYGEAALVEVQTSSCIPSEANASWQLQLATLYTEHKFLVSWSGEAGGAKAQIKVDGQFTYPWAGEPMARQVLGALCQEWVHQHKASHVRLEGEQTRQELHAFMQSLVPACKLAWDDQRGWTCELDEATTAQATATLAEQKNYILRHWVRQPYLFSRRLTLTRHLADALAARDSGEALSAFCHVVQNSLAAELPLLMQSPAWQKAICEGGASANRRRVGALGLDKAIAELSFFLELADLINSQGRLAVQVPDAALSTNEIWVKLKPQADVWDRVLEAAAGLQRRESQESSPSSSSGPTVELAPASAAAVVGDLRVCWHPLFGDSASAMALAAILGLDTAAFGPLCRPGIEHVEFAEPAALSHYLAETIMGETDFMVTNGRYKILRLPQGHYDYTLFDLPDTAARWQPGSSEDKARGTFGWVTAKPAPSIHEW